MQLGVSCRGARIALRYLMELSVRGCEYSIITNIRSNSQVFNIQFDLNVWHSKYSSQANNISGVLASRGFASVYLFRDGSAARPGSIDIF